MFKNQKSVYSKKIEMELEYLPILSEVKNLILEVIYKLEETYPVYEMVKLDVKDKEKYIEDIYFGIKKINKVHLMELEDKDIYSCLEKTKVEKDKNGKFNIYIFKNHLSMLYALCQIDLYDKYTCKETLCPKYATEFLNKAAVSYNVEILRDFSAWSWDRKYSKDENVYADIVFKNLVWILGYSNILDLKKSDDFFKTSKTYLEGKFEKCELNKLYFLIEQIIYLMAPEEERQEELNKAKIDIELIKSMSEPKILLEYINKERKRLSKKIKDLDMKLAEFDAKQETEEKCESNLEMLDLILERKSAVNKLEEFKKIGNPNNYVKYKKELEKKHEIILKTDLKDKQLLDKKIIELQQITYSMLECKARYLDKAEDIIDWLKRQRYMRYQKVTGKEYILKVPELYQKLDNVLGILIEKGIEAEIIESFTPEKGYNRAIISPVFKTKILDLSQAKIAVMTGKNTLLCIYDGKVQIKEFILFDVDSNAVNKKFSKKTDIFRNAKVGSKFYFFSKLW